MSESKRELPNQKFYSQFGQDEFVWNYLNKKKSGIYIDVGAHDGINISNSKFFEDQGWFGLCIEPIKKIFDRLDLNRKKTICINGAVSDIDGEVTFTEIEGPIEMLSGIKSEYDPRHIDRINSEIKTHGGQITEIKVKSFRLETLIDRTMGWSVDTPSVDVVAPSVVKIDYLSIDTEGSELKVLKGIDFDKASFEIIGVEDNYEDDKRIVNFLKEKGYKLLKRLGGDNFFIPK